MRLPEIQLDDRTFQDLVNEARHRVSLSCPEWTDHNVSDPGITLIELFAWFTEMVIYRLNRVPDKLHVALMELMDIGLEPPMAARADLRFRLAAPAVEPVQIPLRSEVGTLRTASEESIVFQTTSHATIPVVQPVAYVVEREGNASRLSVSNGVARPKGGDQFPFATPPAPGDALCLAFNASLANLVIQVDVSCAPARGVGVAPDDPPLRWEVSASAGPGGWLEVEVLDDRTGGFNYGSGAVELQIPAEHDETTVAGERGYWLRCRVDDRSRSGHAHAAYTHPPEISSITAGACGALVPAAHAMSVVHEELGESDGTPGQSFRLHHVPALELEATEGLEVRDPGSREWRRWERRQSFAESGPDDRHYTLDLASGQLALAPTIRSGGVSFRQFGAIPDKGAHLRMSRYRHGGGLRGNVAAGTLTSMKSAIPYVSSVVNPSAAWGGIDAESLDEARRRAALELRSRSRAVTAEDHEFLALQSSPRVARAICVEPPGAVGVARVHIVPRVEPADRQLTYAELCPDQDLMTRVASVLDERRLVGTRVELVPARYRGVSVVASVRAEPSADLTRVEQDVAAALYRYLNPIVGGTLGRSGGGWEGGRSLNQGELYGVIHAVDGVQFVSVLRIYETDLISDQRAAKPLGSHLELEPDELIASGTHVIKAEHPES